LVDARFQVWIIGRRPGLAAVTAQTQFPGTVAAGDATIAVATAAGAVAVFRFGVYGRHAMQTMQVRG
jgi:hypothetical protein